MHLLKRTLAIGTLLIAAACAGRMTADEFDRQFGLGQVVKSDGIAREDEFDTYEARRIAARRSVDAMGMDQMYEAMVHEAAKDLPESQRPRFFLLVQRVLPKSELEELMMRLSVKYLTRRQLEAQATFNQSHEGRSITVKALRTTGPAVPSEGPADSSEDRRVAAQRYLSEADIRGLYGATIRASVRHLPATQDVESHLWEASQKFSGFENELLRRMERYYTRREIDMLRRFHTSREGKAVMTQFPFMMGELLSYFADRLRREAGTVRQ